MGRIYDALKRAQQEGSTEFSVGASSDQKAALYPAFPFSLLEIYQRLRSNINTTAQARSLKSLLFTSANRSEGCSTVALNFAKISARESNAPILLLDTNLRYPSLHILLDLPAANGISDFHNLLSSDQSVDSYFESIHPLETEQENLFFIPAGKPLPGNPSKIFQSQIFKQQIQKWSEKYSLLIFDSPPVNSYPDAVELAKLVEGIILVIYAGRTRWQVVKKAQENLIAAPGNILGAVLNRRQYVIPEAVYKKIL